MNQSSLIIDPPSAADVSHVAPDEQPANDLRHAMMSLPLEQQKALTDVYMERRTGFRKWLLSQMTEGIHYGYPPGCEPKPDPEHPGNFLIWMKGGFKSYPASQWKPKPELYKAGAQFICDLLGVDPKWNADLAGWQQLGSPAGTFVYKCDLYSKASGHWLGEGRGARKVGTKGGDENNGVKMAMKSAHVDAVMNTYGLSDLFVQDSALPPPNPNPEQDGKAPQAPPRNKRAKPATAVTQDQLGHVSAEWKSTHPEPSGDVGVQREKFKGWVKWATQREFDSGQLAEWTVADYQACCSKLGIKTLEELA